MLQGQGVQAVARTGRVEDIGGQHGVEPDPGQIDAAIGQHLHVELDVLADLAQGRILQQGAQAVQHGVAGKLVGWRAAWIIPSPLAGGG